MTKSFWNVVKTAALVCALTFSRDGGTRGQAQSSVANALAANALARDIFKQLIEINTTDSVGNVTTARKPWPRDCARRIRGKGPRAGGAERAKEKPGGATARNGKAQTGAVYRALGRVEARREDGPPIRFSSLKRMDIFTAAAPTI